VIGDVVALRERLAWFAEQRLVREMAQ